MDNKPEEALDRLRKYGWSKGVSVNNKGQMCIGGACENGEGWFGPTVSVIAPIIQAQFPERLNTCIANTAMGIVVSFNDHPETTFADVERVLEKAAVKWEEERVLRHD